MPSEPSRGQVILSHAPEQAYLPLARTILANMGFRIVTEEEHRRLPAELAGQEPLLRIVDESRLAELPDDAAERTPVIVITGRQGLRGADPRVFGVVRRPAGLHELYRLIQQAVERRPRSAPRVLLDLPARLAVDGRGWGATLLSLSESGCLVRCAEPVELGACLELRFELPDHGVVETQAEAAYQLLPDLGLVFSRTAPASRAAIARFVERRLAQALASE